MVPVALAITIPVSEAITIPVRLAMTIPELGLTDETVRVHGFLVFVVVALRSLISIPAFAKVVPSAMAVTKTAAVKIFFKFFIFFLLF